MLIGQAWGAKETHKVKAIAGTAILLVFTRGQLIAVLGGVFTKELLGLLGTPADVLPAAVGYARILMLAMPGLMVFLLVTQLLRRVGDTVTPLFALVTSRAVSCLLTPALIRAGVACRSWAWPAPPSPRRSPSSPRSPTLP